MLHDFLAHLHRGGDFAYYHTLPNRRSEWYEVNDPPPIEPSRAKVNLYFGVHPCTAIPPANAHGEIVQPQYVRAQRRYIAAINCLYAEFDVKDYGSKEAVISHIEGLTVPTPSALVDSGGGVHAYWLLNEPYTLDTDDRRAAADTVETRWVELVGADKSVHDLTRVLRVPGSWNYKYSPARPVQWIACDLTRTYPIRALTAHLPPIREQAAPPVRWSVPGRTDTIKEFNTSTPIDDLLSRYGYKRHGRHRMVSPWSGSGRDGVVLDADDNRAYAHTGSDPLCDGYWKRPFDALRILEYGGDFKRALTAIREGTR